MQNSKRTAVNEFTSVRLSFAVMLVATTSRQKKKASGQNRRQKAFD
jgi:hypothetical protein